VQAFGNNLSGEVVVPPTVGPRALAVAAGGWRATGAAPGISHSLVLLDDGTVAGFGSNQFGQLNLTPPAGVAGITAVSAGGWHSLAIVNDTKGSVIAAGYNATGATAVPASVNDVGAVAVAAGGAFSLALLANGSLATWGASQMAIPTELQVHRCDVLEACYVLVV
jgi:alpha-tubulin suppressor-like RCC1 family protein